MRHLHADQRGQATVEFAVTLPIFLVLILGVIHFGKAFYQEQNVQMASRYVCWKAGRHDPNHSFTAAASNARNAFNLASAQFSGQTSNDTLENLSDFDPSIFLAFPSDPSGLTDPMSFFDFSAITGMLAAGIAPVDTNATTTVTLTLGNQLAPFVNPAHIERGHRVAIGNWDYEEIEGDVVLMAYEAYLDKWAYDEIYGLCDWCF